MMVAPLRDSKGLAGIAENTSVPSPELLVLDTSVFQELLEALGGDLDTVVSVYRIFLGSAMRLIGHLSDQHCAAQAVTLHTLKGSARMVGAVRVARLAAHLQQLAAKSVHPVIKTRIQELTGELNIFRTAIEAHVRSLHYRSEI
jgi:HPt (histidine-containing phosphotransfer) domain-containing protein